MSREEDGIIFGRAIHRCAAVVSTNDLAFDVAGNGAPEGTAVVADSQKEGRGQQGRDWFSPPGVNLYCSFVLRPVRAREEWVDLPWICAVAAGGVLQDLGIGDLTIKKPNDLLAGGKKVAGILLENRQCGNRTTAVVAGMGLNVNVRREDFPEGFAMEATSIRELTGSVADRELILQRLFGSLDRFYKLWRTGGSPAVRKAAEEKGISFTGFN